MEKSILNNSIKDSKEVKISSLKKGDRFVDPYYNNEKCIVVDIDKDGYYKIKSLRQNLIFNVSPRKTVLVDSIKDGESVKYKPNSKFYKEDILEEDVSDYCVFDFPFNCYAKPRNNDKLGYIPVKCEGYCDKNGKIHKDKLVATWDSLDNDYDHIVFYGTCTQADYLKLNKDNEKIFLFPTDIKNVRSICKKATKKDVEQMLKNKGCEVVQDSIKDTDYSNEYISAIQSLGYKLERRGQTFTGRTHFEFISTNIHHQYGFNMEANKLADKIDSVDDKTGCRSTFNFVLTNTGYIKAVVDVDMRSYKDSIKDDAFESRYYQKNKLRVSEDFLEKICNKYNIDVYYEGNEYRLYGLNRNFDNMFDNYKLFDSIKDSHNVRTVEWLDDEVYVEYDMGERKYYIASDEDRYNGRRFDTVGQAQQYYKYYKNDIRREILDSIKDSDNLEGLLRTLEDKANDFTESMTDEEEKTIYKMLYKLEQDIISQAEQELSSDNPDKESIVNKILNLSRTLENYAKKAKNKSAETRLIALAKDLYRCYDRNKKYKDSIKDEKFTFEIVWEAEGMKGDQKTTLMAENENEARIKFEKIYENMRNKASIKTIRQVKDSKPTTLDHIDKTMKMAKMAKIANIANIAMDAIKAKDAVSLKKGDWFISRGVNKNAYADIDLYKVIDDKFQERNGFSESILAEHYKVDLIDLVYNNKGLKKKGTETFPKRYLQDIIVFNSVEEAFKWLNTRMSLAKSAFKNQDSKVKDVSWDDIEEAIYKYYKGPQHSEVDYSDCLRGFDNRTDASRMADFVEQRFNLRCDVISDPYGGWRVKVNGVKDSKPIKDATSNECIEKIKTTSIPEGDKLQYGDMQTVLVQIQNVGLNKHEDIFKYKHVSPKQESYAMGRIWKQGKLIALEEGPLNIVRAKMVEKLRTMQDSKVKDDNKDVKVCLSKERYAVVSTKEWRHWNDDAYADFTTNEYSKAEAYRDKCKYDTIIIDCYNNYSILDSKMKDDDYSYEVIVSQISNPNFDTKYLLGKAYNGLTRGSMTQEEYKELVKKIKAERNTNDSKVKDYDIDIINKLKKVVDRHEDYELTILSSISTPYKISLKSYHPYDKKEEDLLKRDLANEGFIVRFGNSNHELYLVGNLPKAPYEDSKTKDSGLDYWKINFYKYNINMSEEDWRNFKRDLQNNNIKILDVGDDVFVQGDFNNVYKVCRNYSINKQAITPLSKSDKINVLGIEDSKN